MLRINFIEGVDPGIKKRIQKVAYCHLYPGKPGVEGAGDHRIQAYCYRRDFNQSPRQPDSFQQAIWL